MGTVAGPWRSASLSQERRRVGHPENDEQYFARRYEEETAAAASAASREAHITHLELAARYAQFAAAIREVDERLSLGGAGRLA